MSNASNPVWLRYGIYIALKTVVANWASLPTVQKSRRKIVEKTLKVGLYFVRRAVRFSPVHFSWRDIDITATRCGRRGKIAVSEIGCFPKRTEDAVTLFLDAQGRRRNFRQFRSFVRGLVHGPYLHRNLHAFYGRRINSNWRLFSMMTRAFER